MRVSKVLKFANLLRQTYKCQTNFKICKNLYKFINFNS
ncbi:hypothetical protein UNSW3_946 [Campylobacter concisus UNSW3]|uniref:Uncharacterized protein n=1 Tax=Campylobacter concisus UNSW3 TaxID=1242966 RepID=U2EIC7_9BACT|nr:hypothetical protein UNSW3_946 [Campylobacter concisus UNSW3]